MFKNILVAIDGSPTSNRGLKQAIGLAAEQGSTLHVLHVVDDSGFITGYEGGYITQDYVDRVSEAVREGGRKVLENASRMAGKQNVTVRPVLAEAKGEDVAHLILAFARKLRADLIVLGTHGRRGLRRLVMGSDAEAVVREATVPVLLVRGSVPAPRRGAAVDGEGRAAARPTS
jgi:nucleotide-binding universal stress UspA family protein